MAGNIKGITIEIDGDTSKLSSALREADTALKETQSQINAVERSLKFDPGNTDLLRDKFQLLKDRVDETKDRLDTLKEAQRQMDAAGVDKNSDQYRALQVEIDTTESKLKGLQDQTKEFGSVGKQQMKIVGDKVKEVGTQIKAVGDGMTKYITTPILGVGAGALKAFDNVDKGYDVMTKKTGATGDEAKQLQNILGQVASTVPSDFETVGAAIGEVNTRFGVTGDELQNLSTQFIKFADLNNTDVSQSVDTVQKALSAYGLGAEDASAFLDRLNLVGQQTGVSVDKLANGIVQNGAAFQELGLSIDDATAFMGQLEKSGANSETVLSGMRRALKNAAAEGKPLDEALNELQNTIANGAGGMDGLTAAYDLFGKSGDQIYAAVKNGTLDFQNLKTATDDAAGSVSTTFEETLDPMDKFKTVLNEIQLTMADLGSVIGEMLLPVLQTLSDAVKDVKEWWDSLSPETKEMIVKAALIVAALGPVISVIGTLVTTIGTVISVASAVAPVIGAVMAVLTGPVGIILAIIAAVAALAAAIYLNWDKIKEWTAELGRKIQAFGDDVKKGWENLKTDTKQKWEDIKTSVKDKVNDAVTSVKNKWNEVKENTSKVWGLVKDKVNENGGGIKGVLKTYAQGWETIIKGAWNAADKATGGALSNMLTSVISKATEIKDKIEEKIGAAVDFIKELPSKALQWGKDLISNFIDGIKNAPSNLASAASGIAGTIADYLHFSEPDKGPLSDFHTFAPDMVKLFAQGMEQTLPVLERASADFASALVPGAMQNGGQTNTTYNTPVNITVYGAQGQDVNQLADVIQARLNRSVINQKAVFA